MPLPSTVSESTRRRNPHLFGDPCEVPPEKQFKIGRVPTPVIRQHQGDGLNKSEREFFHELQRRYGSEVKAHALTLVLGNGVRYTPDFSRIGDATNGHSSPVCTVQIWEFKGFMRDDAAVKIKVAAALYPLWNFTLVTKRRKRFGWGWNEIIVQP